MRILYCNKYNFAFSGTEVYLFELMELMRSQGHEVALFSMADPRGEPTAYDRHFVPTVDFKSGKPGLVGSARLAAHAIYSQEARLRLRDMIADFRPDVAHVRNIYHHLSPSILWELKAHGIPVVYHLNDFKLICPSYNLVAKGRACERCHGGKFRHVVTQGCYPGPPAATLVLAAEAYVHKWLHTYESCVDRFLAPSRFVKDKLVENGWDAGRIDVLPHFQRVSISTPVPAAHDAPILYFGRLSAEKGLTDLLRAMAMLPLVQLQIAGDGPQRPELENLAAELHLDNVAFAGHVGVRELDHLIARSRFTVFPSRAYETLGKSILESYAWGRTVVASDLGSRRELVHEGDTGLLFHAGNVEQLAGAISFLDRRPELAAQMGAAGRTLIQEQYTPENHYVAMTRLYEQMTSRSRKRGKPKVMLDTKPHLRVAFIGGRGVVSKYSGIEAYYEEIGKRLVDMGHDVTVYCRTYFTPPRKKHNGMRLVRLPTIRSKHLETLVHTLLSTIHATFSRADIVHYHCMGPAVFSFIPRLLGKKTVVTVQGLDWQRKKWGRVASLMLHAGEQAAVRFPNATMTVSKTLQDYYRAQHASETLYVPNGTVIRRRRKASHLASWGLEAGNYILFLGRFSPEKNCHLLIEAFKKLDGPVKLVLAGGSSYTDNYTRRLQEQAGDRVVLLDWVSGEVLKELLTNAMLFVLPSDLEGLSIALLDAMGAGISVLTSDIPENCEVVEGAGFTFKHGDGLDLERMLRLLVSDQHVREAAGRSAQERVRERYMWPRIAEQIESAYLGLVGRKKLVNPSAHKPAQPDLPRNRREGSSMR